MSFWGWGSLWPLVDVKRSSLNETSVQSEACSDKCSRLLSIFLDWIICRCSFVLDFERFAGYSISWLEMEQGKLVPCRFYFTFGGYVAVELWWCLIPFQGLRQLIYFELENVQTTTERVTVMLNLFLFYLLKLHLTQIATIGHESKMDTVYYIRK